MARVTVEDCLQKISNRFSLVILASERTKQLMEGSTKLVNSKNKQFVTALREIAAGKVRFKDNAEKYIDRIHDDEYSI